MSAVADEVQPQSDSQKTQDDAPAQAEPEATTTRPPEWESLREQVRTKPNDSDAWLKLVDVAVASDDYARVNETYEALLEAYPNTVRAKSFIITLASLFNTTWCF